jgi:hypothetical protein
VATDSVEALPILTENRRIFRLYEVDEKVSFLELNGICRI